MVFRIFSLKLVLSYSCRYSTKQKLEKKTADLLRGARLTSLGRWLSQQTVSNEKIIEVQELNESQSEEGSSTNQEISEPSGLQQLFCLTFIGDYVFIQ